MDSSSLGIPGAASNNDSIHGLKFGKKIYFEDGSSGSGGGGGGGGGSSSSSKHPPPAAVPAQAQAPPAKKGKGAGQGGGVQQPPRCQVEGCKVDLTGAKTYYCRHKVCGMHSKAPKVIVGGLEQRFCQQCSRFHQLPEFDQGKRSCRRRLAGHNERRRKPPPGPFASRYGRLATSFHDESSRFRSFLMDFSYPRLTSNGRDLWSTNRSGDRVPGNQWQGILDPSSAAACSHPYLQGPPGVGIYSSSASEVPPGECLTGVSDSSCALSLLSTQPWGNAARNQAPSISASSSFDGTPMTQPSIPSSNYIANSWGFRGHGGSTNSHEIQHEIGLVGVHDAGGAHFSGELELALQRNEQCLNHDPARAYDHSGPGMDWSL